MKTVVIARVASWICCAVRLLVVIDGGNGEGVATIVHIAECLFVIARRNWAKCGGSDGTRLVTLGGVRVWEIGIL